MTDGESKDVAWLFTSKDRIVQIPVIPPKMQPTQLDLQALAKFPGALESFLRDHHLEPIMKDAIEKYPNKRIGLRGIMASKDQPVEVPNGENSVRVIPLEQIIAEGTEQPGILKINHPCLNPSRA